MREQVCVRVLNGGDFLFFLKRSESMQAFAPYLVKILLFTFPVIFLHYIISSYSKVDIRLSSLQVCH